MPRDGSATRERILDAAERLMTDNGYSGTSVDEVIAESSTSKGAFFHHFRSKTELATELVGRYVAADLAHLRAGLEATAGIEDPAERVVAFARFYEDRADELVAEQSGCLYATVLAERQFAGGDVNRAVAGAAEAWRDALTDLLAAAIAARRPAVDVDVAALADHLYTTFEGAFILCRSLEDPAAMRAQLKVFRQLLEAFLGASS
jgi:TetR/AcrR family transcriptional repressor of nem operon